jgi:SPP1 family predicted phage head-tail adaptor
MPPAGRLERHVTIERKTVAQDETGQPVETWTAWKSTWMGKKDIRAEERFRSEQELAMLTHIYVRHLMRS